MKLRPYQERFVESVRDCLAHYQSTLAVMATGLGKTVAFAHIANSWNQGRVLVLAHREELIFQAVEKLQTITGVEPGIEMAASRLDRHDKCKIVVSSVQTMSRPKRLDKFDPAQFGLVITDEAHHSVAATYRRIYDHFLANEQVKHLGVTATPKRADELAMGQVYESVAFDYGIEPASDDGWLVPVRQRVVKVEGLDFSKARVVAGDFNEGDIERIVMEEKVLHRVAAPTVELVGDLATLVFCVTVAHAERMAEIINRYKPGSASFLCGTTPKEDRRRIIGEFKAGKVQFLCNVGVLLEGFDAPNCAAIAMARPTKSLPLYVQVIGRATRPLPGVLDGLDDAMPALRREAIQQSAKPYMVVLDYAGNAGRHKIVTASDVLGGKYGEPIRAYARKTIEEEKSAAGVEESLERAKDELAFLDHLRGVRERERIRAQAQYLTQDVNPYGGAVHATRTQLSSVFSPRQPGDEPSEKQINYLVNLGVQRETAQGYTKRQASVVIDKLLKKRVANDN